MYLVPKISEIRTRRLDAGLSQHTFTVASRASDRFLPKVPIREGDQVVFSYKDKSAPEKVLFGGPVLDIDKAASGNSITYTALDLLFYINGSDISHVFDDTPEAITAWVCSHLGVPFGSAAPTGVRVYMPCLGKRAYEAIMAAYTAASRQNGKKYMPLMRDVNKVCVIEKGALCGAVLEGGYNLTEASYKTSLQNMVNRVVVTNKEGGQVAWQRKYPGLTPWRSCPSRTGCCWTQPRGSF